MPIYRVNDKRFDIPEDKMSSFETDYPEAVVDVYDGDTGEGYEIPVSKVGKFKERFPKWSYKQVSADAGRRVDAKPFERWSDYKGSDALPGGMLGSGKSSDAGDAAVTPADGNEGQLSRPGRLSRNHAEMSGEMMADAVHESVRGSLDRMQGITDNMRRKQESMTQAGRDRRKGAEMRARVMGLPTKLPGLTRDDVKGESSDETVKPGGVNTMSPVAYDVKAVNGELRTQWLMPDGSLTTDMGEADKAEYGARRGRLQQAFKSRMRDNGLDPDSADDVLKQELMDEEQEIKGTLSREGKEYLASKYARKDDESLGNYFFRVLGASPATQSAAVAGVAGGLASVGKSGALKDAEVRGTMVDDARRTYEAQRLKRGDGFFDMQNVRNFMQGVNDVALNPDTYGGVTGSMAMLRVEEIAKRVDSGEELTDGDFKVLQSLMLKQQVERSGSMPHGYNAGKTTAEMVQFMAQMATNPTSGLGKAFARKAAKMYGSKGAKAVMAKILAQTAGDVAASAFLANTSQAHATAKNVMERHVGDVHSDPEGKVTFDGVSLVEALTKGQGAQVIENYTEMLGGHLGGITDFAGKWIGKGVKGLGGRRMVDGITDIITKVKTSDWAKAIGNVERRAQWNGSVGEILEEEAGIVLNSMFVGDNKISDLWDADEQIDIVLGVGLFGGFVSAVKSAGYPVSRMRAKSGMKTADAIAGMRFGDDWESMRAEIVSADESALNDVVRNCIAEYAQSDEQARAIIKYAQAMMTSRGYDLASASMRVEGSMSSEAQDAEDSFDQGVEIAESGDGQRMNDARIIMSRERQRLIESVSEDVIAEYDADPVSALERTFDPGLRDIAVAYVNAKQVYDGMIHQVRNDVEGRIAQSDSMIDSRVNRQTGMIQPATMKLDGREVYRDVYIVNGNVAMYENGSGVDTDNSSESIIIRDAESGKIEFADPAQVLSIGESIDAETQKGAAREQIRQEIAQAAANKIDGVLSFAQGDTYSILDIDSNQEPVTVVGQSVDENGVPVDGSVDIQYPDGEIQSVSTVDLQQWVDAANQERVAQFDSRGTSLKLSADPKSHSESVPVEEVVAENAAERLTEVTTDAEADTETPPPSALSQIPTDEKGNPIYVQAEPDVAWDALMEETDGDEKIANNVIEQEISELEDALKKLDKQKPKAGLSIREKIQAEKDKKKMMDDIQRSIDHWRHIATTSQRRKTEEESKRAEMPRVQEDQVGADGAFAEAHALSENENDGYADAEAHDVAVARFEDEQRIKDEKQRVTAGQPEPEGSVAGDETAYAGERGEGSQERAGVLNAPSSKKDKIAAVHPAEMSDNEKEHRGKLLRTATAIEVEKGIITSTPEMSARKVAESWWDKNVGEPVLYDTEVGEIEINRNSVESSLAHRYGQMKLDAITSLVDGFENAVYLGTMPDFMRQDGVDNHFFAYPIIYDGERCYVFCRAMQDANKNRLYVHEVFVSDKIRKGGTLQTAASQPHGGIALYRDILANVLETGAKTEPQRPNNAVSSDSLLSANEQDGISSAEPNGESSVSIDKVNALSADKQEYGAESSLGQKISEAEKDVNVSPTDKQKEAGNYKKGHVHVGTFDVTIENPKDSKRSGTDADGKKWETTMTHTYGYIRGTKGVDGDHIDVYLSSDIDTWNGLNAFVVDQYNPDGSFDEHKVMLGFNNQDEAFDAYLSNYEDGWEKGRKLDVTPISIDEFEKWIESSRRKTKPFADYKNIKTAVSASSQGSVAVEEVSSSNEQADAESSDTIIKERAYEAAKDLLMSAGIDVIEVSDKEANDMITTHGVSENMQGAENQIPIFSIRTYHGTGADFEAFDFSHIGEGEGAQAYGWGGYVTQVKGIGRTYATNIAGGNILPRIEKAKGNIKQIKTWLKSNEDLDKYLKKGNKHLRDLKRDLRAAEKAGDDGDMNFYRGLIELQEEQLKEDNHGALIKDKYDQIKEYEAEISRLESQLMSSRHLYTVKIPSDNGRNYLNWDDAISDEQCHMIDEQAQTENMMLDFYGSQVSPAEYFYKMGADAVGFQIYRALIRATGSDKGASEFLSRAGFTGIRYAADHNNGGRADGKSNYVIFQEQDMKITDHIRFMRTTDGVVYGWTVGGKVYLNRDAMNPETPLHEYTHLWDEMVRVNNPELWSHGIELMKQTSVWADVMNDPNYVGIRDDVNAVASEVHSRLTGTEGARRLEEMIEAAMTDGAMATAQAVTLCEKIKKWIGDMYAAIKATLGKWSDRNLEELSMDDFIGMTLRDLTEGINPTKVLNLKSGEVFLSEREYIEQELDRAYESRNDRSLTRDEWDAMDDGGYVDAFNQASDNYAQYIKGLSDNGLLQQMYDDGNVKDRMRIRAGIDAAGFDFDKLIDTSKEKADAKIRRARKRKERAAEKFKTLWSNEGNASADGKGVLYRGMDEAADVDGAFAKAHALSEKAADVAGVDKQGNPVDNSGRLIVERVESVDDITDDDFNEPTRTIGLPSLPDIVQHVLSTNGKQVIIKKNIFKRNALRHDELTPEMSRAILNEALYNTTLYGKNKPLSRPNNWIVINVPGGMGNNKLVVLEVNESKDNVEIVHWHEADKRGLEKIRRQAEREDGQLLILPSKLSEEAGALSSPTFDLPSKDKSNDSLENKQMNRVNNDGDDAFAEAHALSENGEVAQSDDSERSNKKEGVSQRDLSLIKSEHLTSVTDGATLSDDAKVPNLFELSTVEGNRSEKLHKQDAKRMRDRVNQLAKTLGVDIEFIEDSSTLEGKSANAKGWYEIETGKIAVVIGNHRGIEDIEATVLHEVVAHHGLRELFGKRFDSFLDAVYDGAENGVKERIASLASKNGWNRQVATEEYLAGLAEQTDFEDTSASWWSKLKRLFMNFLRNCGFSSNVEISDNELRYVLWMSWKNLQHPGAFNGILGIAEKVAMEYELKTGNYAVSNGMSNVDGAFAEAHALSEKAEDAADGGILYRDCGPGDGRGVIAGSVASQEYERAVASTFIHRLDEGWHDHLRSVRAMQEAISKECGREISDHENVYLHALNKSSVDREQIDRATRDIIDPLVNVVRRILRKHKGLTQTDIERYMNLKHGKERNVELAKRDAQRAVDESSRPGYKGKPVMYQDEYAKNRERDYSGLTALLDPQNTGKSVAELETEAELAVAEFEAKVGVEDITELWGRMRALTSAALDKQYTSGLISADVYNELSQRWQWYVPLRGFREGTAGDIYEYVGREHLPELPVGKSASGRTSEAEDILATAMSMLNRAIVAGNKNAMKQKLLNLALKHETPLLSVSSQWYRKEPDGSWRPVYPNITDMMSGDEVRDAVETFDNQMEVLAKTGEAKRGKDSLDLPIRAGEDWKTQEHGVRVMRNGVEYVVWINGNPKMAQAVNGLLNYDANPAGIFKRVEDFNRMIARNVTAFRPDFLVRNATRDIENAMVIMSSRNGARYTGKMLMNVKNLWSPVNVKGKEQWRYNSLAALYKRYMTGKLDVSKDTDRMFDEFMRHGGETGYSQLFQPEEFQRSIEDAIKGKNVLTGSMSAVLTELSKLQPVDFVDGKMIDFSTDESIGSILFRNSLPMAVGYFAESPEDMKGFKEIYASARQKGALRTYGEQFGYSL